MLKKFSVIFQRKPTFPPASPNKIKNNVTKEIADKVSDKQKKQLEQIIEKEQTTLFKGKTFFPLDLFPDTITINLDSIILHRHEFFKSEEVKTYDLRSYDDIIIGHGPISSTIKLIKSESKNPVTKIKHISHTDAVKIAKILGGILKARKEHIDLTKIDSNELLEKIEALGEIYE